MAEKKFATPDGAVQSAELTADYERARKFDAVRVGKLGVYYRSGLKTVFLAYPTLERAFIRLLPPCAHPRRKGIRRGDERERVGDGRRACRDTRKRARAAHRRGGSGREKVTYSAPAAYNVLRRLTCTGQDGLRPPGAFIFRRIMLKRR